MAAKSRGRVRGVLLVSVTGYGLAAIFLTWGAPDLALTQVLVETVTLVIFVLVIRKLPRYFTNRPLRLVALVARSARGGRRHRDDTHRARLRRRPHA